MTTPGKERAVAPDQHDAPDTVQDTRWLNGVNRQLRPDAAAQRLAASQAAAAKRTANAMPEEERKAKRRKHAKEVRERQRAARAAVVQSAGPAAEPTPVPAAEPAAEPIAMPPAEPAWTPPSFALFNEWLQHEGHEKAVEDEWCDFEDDGAFEDAGPEDLQPAALIELFLEWRDSDRQQVAQMDRRVADWVVKTWLGHRRRLFSRAQAHNPSASSASAQIALAHRVRPTMTTHTKTQVRGQTTWSGRRDGRDPRALHRVIQATTTTGTTSWTGSTTGRRVGGSKNG